MICPTVGNSPAFFISPVRNPSSPQVNICHGVHGPCPKMKLLTNAVNAPVKKPVSGPNTMAVIIMIALHGLKFGSGTMENTVLPTTARADMTAIGTSSRACGRLRSKTRRNGTAEIARNSSPRIQSELLAKKLRKPWSSPKLLGLRNSKTEYAASIAGKTIKMTIAAHLVRRLAKIRFICPPPGSSARLPRR